MPRARNFFSLMSARLRSLISKAPEESPHFCDRTYEVVGNYSGTVANKAGRIVCKLRENAASFKVYEAYSSHHAAFIAAVSKEVPGTFPPIYRIQGPWVFCEWIDGTAVAANDIESLSHLYKVIEAAPCLLSKSEFCYLTDFLMPRFVRACEFFGKSKLIDRVKKVLALEPPELFLFHPDLTSDNLVITFDGQIKVIDNELVCSQGYRGLDLCNTLKALSPSNRHAFIERMGDSSSLRIANPEVLAAAWFAREVGSSFVGGKFDYTFSLLNLDETQAAELVPLSPFWNKFV